MWHSELSGRVAESSGAATLCMKYLGVNSAHERASEHKQGSPAMLRGNGSTRLSAETNLPWSTIADGHI